MRKLWKHRLHWLSLLAGLTLIGLLIGGALVHADGTASTVSTWTAPAAVTLQRVGDAPGEPHESVTFGNIDCDQITYRFNGSSTMQSGCFTSTGLGLVSADSQALILSGTDEAVSLMPNGSHDLLVPIPGSRQLADLIPLPTDGFYIGLYRNPLAVMKNQLNGSLQVSGKLVSAAPDVILSDAAGTHLVIDSDSTAFSSNGKWLIVEVPTGSFMRINLETLEETAFAPSFSSLTGLGPLHSQVAVSDDGRYVAIANSATVKVYDLNDCHVAGSGSGAANRCTNHEYWPTVQPQGGGAQRVRHLRFLNDGLLSFEINDSTYELAPRDSIGPLIDYLGLGDSYTSGEGAFDYLAGTDTNSNTCHLSDRSYPLLLSHELFGAGGHSVACSGAVINDISATSDDYPGQAADLTPADTVLADFLPGYVSQHTFVQQYQPRIVTVSIGGNDIGFGDIIENCVEPHLTLNPNGNTCFSTYEDRVELTNLIDRTVPKWTALYRQLRAESPETRLYAIGYPQIAVAGGHCGLNVHLSNDELLFASELLDYLNYQIRTAAMAAGVTYVDIGQALDGHRLCEASGDQLAMNGLTAGNDFGFGGVKIFGRESYHPNALGQRLIEQSILRQTQNFLNSESSPSPPNTLAALLEKQKSGRQVMDIQPVTGMTSESAVRGSTITLSYNGTPNGLVSGSPYRVDIDNVSIGSISSDSSGYLSGQVIIPNNESIGGHLVSIQGRDQLGGFVSVFEPLYVARSNGDADGDGIVNTDDTCPSAVNNGQDNDNDGIDDTCDGFLGSPTLPPNPINNAAAATENNKISEPVPINQVSSAAHARQDRPVNSVTSATPGAPVDAVNRAAPTIPTPTKTNTAASPTVLGASMERRMAAIAPLTVHDSWILADVSWLLACLLLLALARLYSRYHKRRRVR